MAVDKALASMILTLATIVGLTGDPASGRSFEFSIFGGKGLGQAVGQAVHEDTWSFSELTRVWERTDIRFEGRNPPLFGAEAAVYLNPRLGIGISWATWNDSLGGGSDFRFEYDRAGGDGDSRQAVWAGSGEVRSSTIGLNVLYRIGEGRIRGYVTAGPALFLHRLDLDGSFGGGLTDTAEPDDPPIDAIQIPIFIERGSGSSLGFNLGAGVAFQVASRLSLVVEGRYFLCPESTFDWTIPGGTFDGIFYEGQIEGVDLSAEELSYVLDHRTLSLFRFRPSRFQIRVGLRFVVG
jgi:opacity protein-like surface antigen